MGKTALVTGGAKGIGAGIVKALAADGWHVYINYNRSEKAAVKLAGMVGGEAVFGDVRSPRSVDNMLEGLHPPELLINNAGVAHYGLLTDMSARQWRDIFAVNTDGVFNCVKSVLPHMISQKRGTIINISSIWGMVGASCEAAYSASKAAVIGFSKALAKELGPSGIRVNCIAPGVVDTDMIADFTKGELDELKDSTPLGSIGTAEDIGSLAAFLASENAKFITGQVISPNGGFVI